MNILQLKLKGFTLLETLASIAVLSLVIIGPLAVTISSSGYARLTKDTIVATYLAEEAVELLQNQYDSLYIYCKKNASSTEPGGYCDATGTNESTTGQTAWRLFKDKLSSADGEPTCFLPKGESPGYTGDTVGNPNGCAFDTVSMQATSTEVLARYDASNDACKYLVPVSTSTTLFYVASTTGGNVYGDQLQELPDQTGDITHYGYKNITATTTSYICSGVPAHITSGGKVQPKEYRRYVTIDQLPTFETGPANEQYSDDLRVTSSVDFKGINGVSHTIKITRFMHARP